MPDHEQLLEKATAGDREALLDLLEELGPPIRGRIAAKIPHALKPTLDEEDVMQVTYVEAVLKIERFQSGGIDGFRAWLSTLAENNLRDAIRQMEAAKRPDPRKRVVGSKEESAVSLVQMLGAGSMTPSRVAARGEAVKWLEQTLSKLPSDYEKVIRMYDLEGQPIEAVAEALGRRPGAVYMLRSRAHDYLAGLMGAASNFFTQLG